MAKGFGIDRLAYIDLTTDGHFFSPEWERYRTFKDWLKQVKEPVVVFDTDNAPTVADIKPVNVENFNPSKNAWLIFGPSMGSLSHELKGRKIARCYIPTVTMSARDAVPIGLWIMTRKNHG